MHLIDITNEDLLENYSKVRNELFKYSKKLLKKREIIVLNKIDMLNKNEIKEKLNFFKKKIKKEIFIISALKQEGLKALKRKLLSYVS